MAKIKCQVKTLEQETRTIAIERQNQYVQWSIHSSGYLRLKAQLSRTPALDPLVSDTLELYHSRATKRLMTLDTQRVKAQAELTRTMRRNLQISVELKGLAIGRARLEETEGTPEFDEQIAELTRSVEGQYRMMKRFTKRLIEHAFGEDDF
jgi:hypothetical protein